MHSIRKEIDKMLSSQCPVIVGSQFQRSLAGRNLVTYKPQCEKYMIDRESLASRLSMNRWSVWMVPSRGAAHVWQNEGMSCHS
jgi:hypothetical protein